MKISKLLNTLRNPSKRKKVLLIVSGSLIVTGWAAGSVFNSAILFNLLMIIAALLAGYEIAYRAWQGLQNRHTNIELLVTIAAIGGIAIGVYWEAAAVTFLFLLGGWLEARTMSKTRSTLRELINLAPDTATVVLDEGNRKEIPAREVEQDMLVLVKPGSKIPVDGSVESGASAVDESAITGEPIPAEKKKGAEVYAGTINKNGRLYVRAEKAGSDTTLAKIIRRVEEAQEEKAPTQRFIERFARWYTPAIIGLSIGSFLFTSDLELALTLLVIGCPGALVISTPISIISGIGRAAEKGILIKGGEYLENAGKISTVALDKTGTLTEGKPQVTDLLALHSSNVMAGLESEREELSVVETLAISDQKDSIRDEFQQVLYWAAIAETVSEHPLAEAILSKAKHINTIPEPEHFESHTGSGVEAVYDDNRVLVGKQEFLQDKGISIDETIEREIAQLTGNGRTVVLVARNDILLGGIGIADQVRADAPAMIRQLRENGIDRIAMLTGDSEPTARAIADEVGIEEIHAGILPEEKNGLIKKMKANGAQVAMIGDGINDAPALATADVGIAMGAAGTDVAIETADIALMADNLMNIPEALRVSTLTLRNIHQNVGVALLTVGALLTGVFMGTVHMAGGMLVHELSVMLVILNGMRLRWI